MSIRNKNDKSRCPYPSKDGVLCGVHQRAKNVQMYVQPTADNPTSIPTLPLTPTPTPTPTLSINVASVGNSDGVESIVNISPNSLKPQKKVAKHVQKQVRDCEHECERERERSDSFDDILHKDRNVRKIQKWIRGIWRSRIARCCNESDFITFEKLADIPYPMIYFHHLENGIIQGYDIRSVILYIDQSLKENPTKAIKNPFTCENFTNEDLMCIETRANVLKLSSANIKREEIPMNPEVEFQQYVLGIFQKMDFLDNYTNMDWFLNLTFSKLKKLYYAIIDIWTYRAQLPSEVKRRIVHNGFAFPVHNNVVERMPDSAKNKRVLQKIILREFERFITEGATRDDRKLGCIFMLTGLVEVSPEAANALPQYVQ